MGIGLKEIWTEMRGAGILYKLSGLKRSIKYAWQRAWRGYDDMELFNIDSRFIARYKEILKDYRENHFCLFNVPEEYRSIFQKYSFSEDETDAIIDTMIFHLEMMDEDYVQKKLFGKNVYDDDYDFSELTEKDYGRIYSIVEQNKKAFMKLFDVFFWELWD